jgi:putative hydrolase of HD superfamily
MKNIAKLLFEANMLKNIPRSGYHFLGTGKESVAEHSFSTVFIAYVMSQMEHDINALKLIDMCLVHDLPESRTGDLNYVQKNYVTADEDKAVNDATQNLPFGHSLAELTHEFRHGESMEARLARDADQLSFILELKALSDIGYHPPGKWLKIILKRLETKTGKKISKSIMSTKWDAWWMDNYNEKPGGKKSVK